MFLFGFYCIDFTSNKNYCNVIYYFDGKRLEHLDICCNWSSSRYSNFDLIIKDIKVFNNDCDVFLHYLGV